MRAHFNHRLSRLDLAIGDKADLDPHSESIVLLRFLSFLFSIPVLWTSDFTQTHRIDFKYFLKFHQETTEKNLSSKIK